MSDKNLCYVPRPEMATEEAVQVSNDVFNQIRESSDAKILLIEDLLERAEQNLVEDERAESSRNELEVQRRQELQKL